MDILNSILAFVWFMYFWESYLSRRQRRVYETSLKVPKELTSVIDESTFNKSRSYALDKSRFGFWHGLYSQFEATLILKLGGYAALWAASGRVLDYFDMSRDQEIVQTLVFTTLGQLFSTVTGLPWTLYSTFVLEERHGFNKMSLGFFLKDMLKKLLLSQVLTLPLLALIVQIIKVGGEYFYVYAWAAVFVISLVLMHVYPEFIAPLFDRYDPLPEGELKQKIERLAASLEYPLTKLYVVDGSKRSAHSNAYMYGFHKNKRIVLFDTLLEDYTPVGRGGGDEAAVVDAADAGDKATNEKKIGCNNEEVVAVLAHELGHWYHSHMLKNVAIIQAKIFLSFFIFGKLMYVSSLFEAFGFPEGEQPILIRLIVIFSFVFAPFDEIEEFLMHLLSRCFEFQADEFAVRLGKRELLKSSLLKLHKDNLSFPVADWMYSARHFSHPPILERLRAMEQIKLKGE